MDPVTMAATTTSTVLLDVYDVLTDILAPATTTMAGIAGSVETGTSPMTPGPDGTPPPLEHAPDCRLLDRFAISVQLLMGALALSSLVYKRHREHPRRPVKIWSFDISKQVLGQLFVHILNILVSVLVGHQGKEKAEEELLGHKAHGSNPCVWYILNLLVDCTLGVGILYLFLYFISHLLARPPCNIEGVLPIGQYAPDEISQIQEPQKTRISYWAKQTAIYVICLFLMKLCVLLFFELVPSIFAIGHYILQWTESDTRIQVAFVMLIFPLIMNIIQFWLIDTILKAKARLPVGSERDPDMEEERLVGRDERLENEPDAAHGSGIQCDAQQRKVEQQGRNKKGDPAGEEEAAALLSHDDNDR